MQIHTVKSGETVYSIAREYGTSPTKLIENNGITNPDRLTVGEELLIILPTRTYSVTKRDTLPEIGRRFSVSRESLMRANPSLAGTEKLYPEQILAIKYEAPSHSIALINGYLYSGFKWDRLELMLPYLTHLTLSSHVYRDGKLKRIFDPTETAKRAKALGKEAMIRIFSREPYDKESFSRLANDAGEEAMRVGANGITLSLSGTAESDESAEFFFDIKRKMLEYDLKLFVEGGERISKKCADAADAVILNYDKYALAEIPTFRDGEERIYTDFAERMSDLGCFLDLSPFAYKNREPIDRSSAKARAREFGYAISCDEESMTMSFTDKGGEKTLFPSLKNIKARLDLAAELGYLGFSVDVMRCPTEDIMMIHSLFSPGADHFSGGI